MYIKCLECRFLKTQKIMCVTFLPMEGTKKEKLNLKSKRIKLNFNANKNAKK